jgi:hypothetical protein
VCAVENLPVGTYTVTEINPQGYTSTTSDVVEVQVIAGQWVEVYFGDWRRPSLYLPVILEDAS